MTSVEIADVVVIGAGIAGLSAAAALSVDASVVLVEMEDTAAHHATGRSAALFLPTYGPATVRRLAAASAEFFRSAGHGRSGIPLVTPRSVMYVADEAHRGRLVTMTRELGRAGGRFDLIDAPACRERCPALRHDWVVAGAVDPDALDIDVAATVATFRSELIRHGGRLQVGHQVIGLDRMTAGWTVHTTGGSYSSGTVVNAAGAWVDQLATLAGVAPLGFQPKRRTMAVSPFATDADPGDHFVAHATMNFYFSAERGDTVMFSPADETLSEPTDAQPEEIDVARAIDRINEATTLGLRSVRQSWAGLRTFSPDGDLVIGPDAGDPTFVWCAGQGGYGIETSPAAGLATAALASGRALPEELRAVGLTPTALTSARFDPRVVPIECAESLGRQVTASGGCPE
ncbi:MAG: FAD-dependent oxidoreductase [Ilumatobacteraceae bacterium]